MNVTGAGLTYHNKHSWWYCLDVPLLEAVRREEQMDHSVIELCLACQVVIDGLPQRSAPVWKSPHLCFHLHMQP